MVHSRVAGMQGDGWLCCWQVACVCVCAVSHVALFFPSPLLSPQVGNACWELFCLGE